MDRNNILEPDKKHLHSILYSYNVHKMFNNKVKANYFASVQIIVIQIINAVYIVNFYNSKFMIILGIILFILSYEFIYKTTNLRLKY